MVIAEHPIHLDRKELRRAMHALHYQRALFGLCTLTTYSSYEHQHAAPHEIELQHALRMLGIHYHHDGSGAAPLSRLQQTVTQLTHLIQRVCSRRHGLKEADK